jgi:hypothetical protein
MKQKRIKRADLVEVVDDAMADVLRLKTPAERLAIANRMWTSAQRMIRLVLKQENPTWPDERIEQETARRLSHGSAGTS